MTESEEHFSPMLERANSQVHMNTPAMSAAMALAVCMSLVTKEHHKRQ